MGANAASAVSINVKPSSSPIKLEPHVQAQISPKVKFPSTPARHDEANDLDSVGDTFGVDLQAEKRTLLASTKMTTNLDQIKACKDEKFLNILVLHKKFVDIGK